MTAATTSNVPSIFKEIWLPGMESQFYPTECPAWALCPKTKDWDGTILHATAGIGGMNGVSSTFARAKANQSPSLGVDFQVTSADRFALWSIDHKAMHLARNDRGRQVELVADQTHAAMERLMLRQASTIHGGVGQAVGRIAAGGIAGSTITLEDPQTAKNFEEGDLIFLSDNNGNTSTDALLAGAGFTVVTIDPDAGTLLMSAGIVATFAAAAAGNYLFIDGDFQAGCAGYESWNPLVVPAAAFFGVVRNTGNITRKAGIRKDVSATVGAVNKIRKALTAASAAGSKFTHMFVDPEFYSLLDGELGNNVRYVDKPAISADGGETTIGFTGIKFTQHGGAPVEIYPDAYAPLNVARGVNYGPAGFRWVSAGDFPMWLTPDGKPIMHSLEGTNAMEGRAGGYGNYVTKRPLDMGRFKLA